MTLILRELKASDEVAFRKMLEDWDDSPGFNMLYGLMSEMQWSSILQVISDQKVEAKLSASEVPATSLYAFVGDEIIGKVSIRHRLNEYLENIGGHIGYGVLAHYRGKGYASMMLGLALAYCRTIGLPKVLITSDESNLASCRIIEKNGGIQTDPYQSKNGGTLKLRYWIYL